MLLNTNTMKPVISPIGLDYTAGYLKCSSVDVSVFDFNFDRELPGFIRRLKPDVIGIGIRNTDDCTYPSGAFFLPAIKRVMTNVRKITQAPVVLGGLGFSIMPESVMKYLGADFGICGDGEDAFLGFMAGYPRVKGIPGLIYRENKSYIKNKSEPFALKKLRAARDNFNNREYFRRGGMGNIETKRGCIKECIYCADPVCKGKTLRFRENDSIIEEIKSLLKQGVNCFHLCDSEFNIPYEHAADVCRSIIKRGINRNISWYCYCSPVKFDASLALLMKEAGCKGINFGVDSGSNKILKVLKKDYSRDDIAATCNSCRKAGIPVMFDLLLGGPSEDKESVLETIGLMKQLKPDVVGTAVGVRVYGGTYLGKLVKMQGVSNENPNLHGCTDDNDELMKPVFFISSSIGEKIFPLVEELVKGDKRFMFSYSRNKKTPNYNYNQNIALVNAIKKGARGAYWDILRKITG